MATYKITRKLSGIDAAYIAGLIDGEGSVGLLRKHKTDNRQLVVSVSNNDLSLLRFIVEATGVGKITNKHSKNANHQHSYTFTVTNRQALHLLEQITPMLRTYKLKRAELILDQYQKLTPRNGKYTDDLIKTREAFIKECMEIKA